MREASLEDQDAYSMLLARSGLDETEMRQILTRLVPNPGPRISSPETRSPNPVLNFGYQVSGCKT